MRVVRSGLAILLASAATAWAQMPKIALVGGPRLLWPEIIQQYEKRFPSQPAEWLVGGIERTTDLDLIYAYYATGEELKSASPRSSRRWMGFPAEFVNAVWKQPIEEDASARAALYLDQGGVENGVRLLQYLYSIARPGALAPEPPLSSPQAGIYHPEAPEVFVDYPSYRTWWQKRMGLDTTPRAVAIPFFSSWLRGRDLALVEALVRKLESAGCLPVAVFGYPLDRLTPLLQEGGRFQPEAVIALNGSLSGPKDADVYASWNVPVFNGLVTRESEKDWQANPKGLPADRIAAQLSFPERAGFAAPTLVATTETSDAETKSTQPLAAGVDRLVQRALRILALRSKPNSQKRVALIYYNNPPGKGNVGASYLQVFPSLRNILSGLATEGYRAPEPLSDETELRRLIEGNGRNLELWAEGEKARLAATASVVRWPVAEYRRYYDELPAGFRKSVEQTWGLPENSMLMAADCPTGRCFLIPALRSGNFLLAPQPLRTTFEQASNPDHEKLTPPPHQYVAFYLWLQHVWKADALVHLGRHGTLEWLPEKQTALASEDAPEILLGDLPNFNIYVMDGGGEAIQAKRRGSAVLISHLTPMIWRAGGRADFEKLHQSFHELMDKGDVLSPTLLAEYERVTRAEVIRLGLDKQLQLETNSDWKAMAPALHRFLHEIEDSPVPAGLPVFGQSPREDQVRDGVAAYLFASFPREMHDEIESSVPEWAEALCAGREINVAGVRDEVSTVLSRAAGELPAWIQAIRDGGRSELGGLARALRGDYVPSRLLGDPLRKPEALPTGANLHAVDSARIPTDASWRVGQKMAQEFLDRYRETHGVLPKRVSVVLWYGETERQQGAMESMAMALLGVTPVWNPQGIVDDLRLTDRQELGRDRVDVVFTVSGNYRDGFADKLQLLDRAVRLAASAPDGVLAERNRQLAAQLEGGGLASEEAARQSEYRIFSAKPGAYGVGIQPVVEKSGGGDSAANIAALYISNMAFGYSGEHWGAPAESALRANLATVDAVQFSRSSNVYGTLDNDDTYQYLGGLRTAVEQLAKHAPDVYLHNLRRPGEERMTALREWLAVELQSRQFNPKWIEEMQHSGYAGAREISREVEHLYGFQKTAPDHLSAATWQTVMDVFVKDNYRLGLQHFFQDQNPHARQTLIARLLEVDRQQIYRFAPADRRLLLTEYARSLERNGAACSAQVCGNVALRRHVAAELRRSGEPAAAAKLEAAFRNALEKDRHDATPRTAAKPLPQLRKRPVSIVTWIAGIPKAWKAKPLPGWVWIILGATYTSIVIFLLRPGRKRTVIGLGIERLGEDTP
jgi:cobaltochelatase CobN